MRCIRFLLALAPLVTACNIVGVDADSFEGRYALRAVNREPLPYRFLPAGPDSTEVLAGFIQVRDTLLIWVGFTTRFKQNGSIQMVNDSFKLGWSQQGGTLTFFDSDGTLFPPTRLEDGAFDLVARDSRNSTNIYSYRR